MDLTETVEDMQAENETQNETQPEPQPIPQPIKIDRRTIKRAPWRTITLPDGTIKYNDKPNDPLYFQKYYDAKRKFQDAERYICECCNKEIAYGHKARHQKTKSCIKKQNEKIASQDLVTFLVLELHKTTSKDVVRKLIIRLNI